jgi:nicotianamine synthase
VQKGVELFFDENDVMDFEVLTIFHPTDDVINSVVLLQKPKA